MRSPTVLEGDTVGDRTARVGDCSRIKAKELTPDLSQNLISEEKQLGGVYIDPTLVKEGSEMGNIKIIILKEQVIKSRPSQDSLSWPVGIPKEKSENREEEKP